MPGPTAISLREMRRLYRADLPVPVDVPNFIDLEPNWGYPAYALTVQPLLRLSRGRPMWLGQLEGTVAGQARAQKLMIVRYPSHRNFLRMVMAPGYLALNRLRERGVKRFEASFTAPVQQREAWFREPLVLVIQYNSTQGSRCLGEIKKAVASEGGRVVYASRETSPMSFLRRFRPVDPNPLEYAWMIMAAFPDDGTIADRGRRVFEQATCICDDCAVSIYRRQSQKSLLRRPA